MSEREKKETESSLRRTEILGYGLGGFSSTLPNQFKAQFGMSFLTDVAGISGSAVGVLSMLTTVWDALNDPLIGYIADRTRTKRFGRYRPHMICGALGMATVLPAMFCVPFQSGPALIVYYCILMILFSVFFTQFTVPWQALNSIMSTNTDERNRLLVSRQIVGAISVSLVGLITMPLVSGFSNEKNGWLCAASLTALIVLLFALCAVSSARRQDVCPLSTEDAAGQSFFEKIKSAGKNRAVLFASLMLGIVNFAITINSGISIYYLRYVVGNQNLLTVISLIQILVTLILVPFLPRMLHRWGKLPMLRCSMFLSALSAILLLFLREHASISQVILISLFSTTGLTFSNICCFSLLPDCTDYTELYFGSAQAGFVNAVSTFVRKLCGSFSYLLIGVLLDLVGYNSDLPVRQSWINMIVSLKVAVPLIALAAVLLLSHFYPITSDFAKSMAVELRRRREQNGQA